MPIEQVIQIALQVGALALGGGVLGVVVKAMIDNKIAKRTSENEAKRDATTAWGEIVESLQAQITSQTSNFTEQMTVVSGKLKVVEQKVEELQMQITLKDRTILKAIGHIGKLEVLIVGPIPERPEELK